jgi:hypothetical protein
MNPMLRIRILDPGCGVRCFFDPWIGDGKKSGSGSRINILNYISNSLVTSFGLKILKFFVADPDSVSGTFFLTVDPNPIWKNSDPG